MSDPKGENRVTQKDNLLLQGIESIKVDNFEFINLMAMDRFKKDKLSLLHGDSITVKRLKYECNVLIEQYNGLQTALSDQGQLIATQINTLIMKINQIKDSNYDKIR